MYRFILHPVVSVTRLRFRWPTTASEFHRLEAIWMMSWTVAWPTAGADSLLTIQADHYCNTFAMDMNNFLKAPIDPGITRVTWVTWFRYSKQNQVCRKRRFFWSASDYRGDLEEAVGLFCDGTANRWIGWPPMCLETRPNGEELQGKIWTRVGTIGQSEAHPRSSKTWLALWLLFEHHQLRRGKTIVTR